MRPAPLGVVGSGVAGSDPYRNPELFRWVGSMEGVPEWVPPDAPAGATLLPESWRRRASDALENAGAILPGLALALALAALGEAITPALGEWLFGTTHSPISPILLGILSGLAIRNTIGLPGLYDAGLIFALKRVLRVGVALLGVRLSLAGVASVGASAVPIVIACIVTALAAVHVVSRALGVSGRMGALIAVGTAICGNTAIVATGPVIRAERSEMSYAVGAITLFGLLALIVYPFLSHALFGGDPKLAGLFLGTSIHDTAQVAGAGLLYLQQFQDPTALETATVTKLLRNLFMLAVIPCMAFAYRGEGAGRDGLPLSAAMPWFVVGFVAMAGVRTVGDLGPEPMGGLLSAATWSGLIAQVSTLSTWCLAVAMASVGLGTDVGRLRALGWRPLGLGLTAALTVGVASALLIFALRAGGQV